MTPIIQKIYDTVYTFLLTTFGSLGQKTPFTGNVMAPLFVEENEWKTFENQLQIAKEMGITAVSTDVWWGLVEATDGVYNWTYYDKILQKIEQTGLKWMPIMSFHMCGPNVGDEHRQPLPEWIWRKLVAENPEIESAEDLKYVSEEGTSNHEIIALWADKFVLPIYARFLENFKQKYASKTHLMEELNVSFGAAGELRYPSYNYHDNGNYPNRGRLQCYSRLALQDFRTQIKNKYRTIKALNKAWGVELYSFDQVHPPDDADVFFKSNAHKMTLYGREFMDWYNESLINHGRKMLKMTADIFKENHWADVPIGFKIPGIHWRIVDTQMPRSAEMCAGLIPSYDNQAEKNGFGYRKIIENIIPPYLRKRVVLHFTCLEMSDDEGGEEAGSKAKTLVRWVGSIAHKLHITIKGENALASGIQHDRGWDNIEDAIRDAHYSGLTTLRIGEATTGVAQRRYAQLIQKYGKN